MKAGRRPYGTACSQCGLGLVELLVATALASILLGTLFGVTLSGLGSQTFSRERNEMVYQARFALDSIVARARLTTPPAVALAIPPARSTGSWFSPTMYCLKTSTRQLIETTTADSACTGTRVIAENVVEFSAQPLAASGLLDPPAVTVALTVSNPGGSQMMPPLSAVVRLGGGTL